MLGGDLTIKTIQDAKGEIVKGDRVLTVLKNFYQDLYSERNVCDKHEMSAFLADIPNIPKIAPEEIDGGEIKEEEVLAAIDKLNIGKAPGSDGLTAEFYKKFHAETAVILTRVFNEAMSLGALSPSQRLAIIILLYKKGQKDLAGNY